MKHKHYLIMNHPKEVKKSWHTSTVDELMDFFLTSQITGLSSSEVFKRSQSLGSNCNGIIGNSISSFFKTACLRDKKRQTVNSVNLVLGDIVFLEKGKMVPADVRLLEVNNLAIDNSLLNGNSAPSYKNALATSVNSSDPVEYKNMAYAGTFVLNGKAKAVVVAVGPRTEAAKLGITSSKISRSWSVKRKLTNLFKLGVVVQNSDILKQLKFIDTVFVNLPLQSDDYKELIRVLYSKKSKNIIICNSRKNALNLERAVPGIVHLDKNQFNEKSNKALLEADHTIMFFDEVGQPEIIRYAKLLKLKNRSVLCIDDGQDSQIFQAGFATLTVADMAVDKSIFEADIIISDVNNKPKFIKQVDNLVN
ncbi:hypothetical protein KBC51_03735 [Candidatus Saccharibacteria bacterium]|nr:hypothetical protein [Candidatus Saccharibacteria bacterium]